MTYVSAPRVGKTLREKSADSFNSALATVLAAALEDALNSGDHEKAVAIVNRGFAEGSPDLGCDLLHRAISVVGTARTWSVRLAPLNRVAPGQGLRATAP
ncbi:hypothetical protein [Actinoplanes solisilvae]|uniref:hypothetical protein n=1 Tax=Actinoplanes solisilvae TaxID=2486853 RepID=UPI000FD89CBD|nr:hypothetical protein [Actinoplanes solisilvae]